jgi:hypothetical protein
MSFNVSPCTWRGLSPAKAIKATVARVLALEAFSRMVRICSRVGGGGGGKCWCKRFDVRLRFVAGIRILV